MTFNEDKPLNNKGPNKNTLVIGGIEDKNLNRSKLVHETRQGEN